MNDNIKVDKSFVESLVEGAAWDAARITLVEKKAATKEMKEADDEEEDLDPSGTKKELDQKESVEVHECPLCESVLEEELSDEAIFEHVAQIQEALKTLEEKKEVSEDEEEDEKAAEADAKGDPDFDESKSSKKEVVMKKVKELKASAKGK